MRYRHTFAGASPASSEKATRKFTFRGTNHEVQGREVRQKPITSRHIISHHDNSKPYGRCRIDLPCCKRTRRARPTRIDKGGTGRNRAQGANASPPPPSQAIYTPGGLHTYLPDGLDFSLDEVLHGAEHGFQGVQKGSLLVSLDLRQNTPQFLEGGTQGAQPREPALPASQQTRVEAFRSFFHRCTTLKRENSHAKRRSERKRTRNPSAPLPTPAVSRSTMSLSRA